MLERINAKKCEICACDITKIRHKHHIIPRTDPKSTNHPSNLAYICPNCHHLVHAGEVIIEGVFLTTAGHKMFFHKKGEPFFMRPGVILNADGTADVIE